MTPASCPGSVRSNCPLVASQSLTVWSEDPEASWSPRVSQATDLIQSSWPLSVHSRVSLPASQSFTVWSPDPEASRSPRASHATDLTQPP